jgi:hypothetical protein
VTLRTLRQVAFLRVIKKDYPRRDEYYWLLLNFLWSLKSCVSFKTLQLKIFLTLETLSLFLN